MITTEQIINQVLTSPAGWSSILNQIWLPHKEGLVDPDLEYLITQFNLYFFDRDQASHRKLLQLITEIAKLLNIPVKADEVLQDIDVKLKSHYTLQALHGILMKEPAVSQLQVTSNDVLEFDLLLNKGRKQHCSLTCYASSVVISSVACKLEHTDPNLGIALINLLNMSQKNQFKFSCGVTFEDPYYNINVGSFIRFKPDIDPEKLLQTSKWVGNVADYLESVIHKVDVF